MRFVLAISALVLSGILLILGIGQTTFLAGPRLVSYSADLSNEHGLAVIPAPLFTQVEGQANVSVTGVDPFIAIGHERDVEAWAAPFAHEALDLDASATAAVASAVQPDRDALLAYAERMGIDLEAEEEAEADASDDADTNAPVIEAPSPVGSDLWLEERTVEAAAELASDGTETQAPELSTSSNAVSVRMPVSLKPDQAVLVKASTEAPVKVSLEWIQDRRAPWAGPLMVAGGVLALVGAILYLLAVDHDRRGLGPRRGRKGPLIGIRNVLGDAKRKRSSSAASASSAAGSSASAGVTGHAGDPGDADTADSAGAIEGPEASKSTGTSNDGVTPQGTDGNDAPVDTTRERRARAPRRFALPALALAAAVGLTGCSPHLWPEMPGAEEEIVETTAPETPASSLAPVPVTQSQIDRVLKDVERIAAEADQNLDPDGLDARFVGDALAEREANYTIRKAVSDYEVLVPRITSETLGYQLVQSTESWPRTVFVVVASASSAEPSDDEATDDAESAEEGEENTDVAADAAPSLALIMTQASPHSQYLVSRVIALRGGITMPEAAPAEEGTARLANDAANLVMTPGEVGPAYASLLVGNTDTEEAALFDSEDDTLLQRSGAAWVAQSTEAASSAGQAITYSVTAEQSDSRIVALSTGAGGALVATTVMESRVEEPEGDTRWRPTVPKSLSALSGLEGQQDRLVSVVAHQLLFYVPGATTGGQIQLLGYTSDLVAASN